MNQFDTITNLFGRYGDCAWTEKGSLIKMIKLSGLNPSSLSAEDLSLTTYMLRNVLITVPSHIVPTLYLINRQGAIVQPSDSVEHSIGKKIDIERAAFLTSKDLSTTDLFLSLECLPSLSQYGKPSIPNLFTLIMEGLISQKGREKLKIKFSNKNAVLYFNSVLDDMALSLNQTVDRLCSRFTMFMDAEAMTIEEIYARCQFLSTYNPKYLDEVTTVPNDNWAKYLFDGDVDTVVYGSTPCLEIRGSKNRYVRFGSISGFTGDKLKPAAFAYGEDAPLTINDNFVYCQRFHPFSPLMRAKFFKDKEAEVGRQNLKISDMLNQTMDIEKKRFVRKSQIDRIEELDAAADLPEQWSYTTCHFALFDNPESFAKRSNLLQARFEQAGASVVWESSAIRNIYASILPSMVDNPIRKLSLNTSQFCAIAPIYCDSQGQKYCKDLDNLLCLHLQQEQKNRSITVIGLVMSVLILVLDQLVQEKHLLKIR